MKNLIGISGKLQSGKDSVYNIIQELSGNKYKNKKFAGKLKQITSLLIGCSVDDLEDNDFKNKPLSEDWRRWFCRYKGNKYHGFFKDTLVPVYFESESEALAGRDVDEYYVDSEILTPRKILQILGTDCGRDLIHSNILVNSLFSDYKPENFWIITDVRFPNEANAIKKRGGVLIRIDRPGIESSNHASETSLDDYSEWDHKILNNGSLKDLEDAVINTYLKL
jgi:hypothetical protein